VTPTNAAVLNQSNLLNLPMEPSCQIYQKDGSCPRFFKGECRSTHPAVCQHNNDCFDERCKYLHERGWCRFAKSCNKPDCIFRHPRQCKFGARCKNKERDCPFRHLKEDKPRSDAAKPEKPSQARLAFRLRSLGFHLYPNTCI
jgi:hypothetical protein